MDGLTRKGWTPATLERLGVDLDMDARFVFHLPTGAVRYADDGRTPKAKADAGTVRDLWPAPSSVPGDELVVVEGEPDAVSATELGLAAVALPGAGKVNPEWPARLAEGRARVVFVCDADTVGRTRMRNMAAKVAAFTEAVVIDPAPDREDGYDLGDMLVDLGAEGAGEAIRDAIMFAPPVDLEAAPATNGAPPAPVSVLEEIRFAEIPPANVEWGLHPYLPLGKVSIIAGAPGQGKSQFTLMIAALVTIGGLPGALAGHPRDVVIITGEDDAPDTVVPRLLAAGADMSRCVGLVARMGEETDLLSLPTHGIALREYVRKRDVGMVVLDPVSAFMDPNLSAYRNVDVRRALAPLKRIAEEHRLMSVVVHHLNKAGDREDPLGRITDSAAYVQFARSVLMMGPHPDDEDGAEGAQKLLVVAKSNIAPPGSHGLELRVASQVVRDNAGESVGTSMVTLGGASSYGAADLFLTADSRGELGRAQTWLFRTLAGKWLAREDIDAQAKQESISQATLRRALPNVGRKSKEAGVAYGRWFWTHKNNPDPPPWESTSANDPHTPKQEELEQVDANGVNLPNLSMFGDKSGEEQVDDLADYRRQRDAMLGERWEDDDDA